MAKTYECRRKDCDLGTKEHPGRFTNNKGECPNCGRPGSEPR
jgi:hypothetical protein